jgi:hypothetical protein
MDVDIKYAKSGAVNIAYQVIGDASLDLVVVPGWVSNIDCCCGTIQLSEGS